MKSLILILLVGTTVVLCVKNKVYDLTKAEELFEKFIKDYNKSYKDDEDKKIHFEAFKKNLERINKKNQEEEFATFDIDEYTDSTKEEWEKTHLGFIPSGTTEKA